MTAAEWSDGAAGPVLNLFDELTDPAERWQDRGLCSQADPDAWFPAKGQNAEPAKAICRRCLVQPECLAYALDLESRPEVDPHGIYGGVSAHERKEMLRDRRREAAA